MWEAILTDVKRSKTRRPRVPEKADTGDRLGFAGPHAGGERFDRFATSNDQYMSDPRMKGNGGGGMGGFQQEDRIRRYEKEAAKRAIRAEKDRAHNQRVRQLEHKDVERQQGRVRARAKVNLRNLAYVEDVERKMVKPVGKRTVNTIVNNYNVMQGKESVYSAELRARNVNPDSGKAVISALMRKGDDRADMRDFLRRHKKKSGH